MEVEIAASGSTAASPWMKIRYERRIHLSPCTLCCLPSTENISGTRKHAGQDDINPISNGNWLLVVSSRIGRCSTIRDFDV